MSIGLRIKEIRKQKKMTQAELANKLGIPYQSIGQWERGVRNPKVETIGKIARALDVNLLSILEGSVTVEEISAEIDMPEEIVYAALYTPDKVSEDVRNIVNSVAPMLAIELSHSRNDEIDDKKSPVVSFEGQTESVEKSSISDMSVHISPDSVARAAEEVFYQQANKSLTVEEIKNAFRGKSIEELSEILAAVSKEISEQAAQVSSSND